MKSSVIGFTETVQEGLSQSPSEAQSDLAGCRKHVVFLVKVNLMFRMAECSSTSHRFCIANYNVHIKHQQVRGI